MSEKQKLKEAAQLIKEMCSKRKHCKECIFRNVDDAAPLCELTNWPDRWNVERGIDD
jgi:hypothetical protein